MTATARPAHLHGLDGIRGVACLAVFVDHVEQYAEWLSWPHAYGPALQALGRQGVELFFVLSGYLITYRMLLEQRARGRVSIPAFYMRRALRIWPLYYLLVFVAFVAVPWLMHHTAGTYVRDAWSWYLDGIPGDGRLLLYVILLPQIAYFTAPPVLCAAHLWSIGVEEQFYIVWPWLMRLAGRRPLAMFTLVVLAGFALNDVVFPWGEQLRRLVGGDALEHLRMYADHAHMEAMAIGAFVGWGAVHERPLLERLAADPLARVFAYLALPFGWYFYLNWHTEIGPALVYAFALAMLSHGPRKPLPRVDAGQRARQAKLCCVPSSPVRPLLDRARIREGRPARQAPGVVAVSRRGAIAHALFRGGRASFRGGPGSADEGPAGCHGRPCQRALAESRLNGHPTS